MSVLGDGASNRGTAPSGLDVPPGRNARRPRPLKIEAAKMAGDVDDFADEIESGDGPAFERLRRKFRGVDAAERDFRGAVAFGAVRPHPPLFYCRDNLRQHRIGKIGDPFRASDQIRNGARQPLRQTLRQRGRHFLPGMAGAQFLQRGQHIGSRREVDHDVLALSPIGRNLQDDRSAQAAMGEQQRLVERRLAAADDGIERNAGEIAKLRDTETLSSLESKVNVSRFMCSGLFPNASMNVFRARKAIFIDRRISDSMRITLVEWS